MISSEIPFRRKVVRISLIFHVAINFFNKNLLVQRCGYSRAWLGMVNTFKTFTFNVPLTLQLVMKESCCIIESSWQY